MMTLTYEHTKIGCKLNFFLDAVNCTFIGLLYTTLQAQFDLDITQLAFFSTVSWAVMAVLIPAASLLTSKIGFRTASIITQLANILALFGMAVLPYVMNPYIALVLVNGLIGFGNGMIEATNNAIFESLPLKNKDAEMNKLHSTFSFGQVIVILLSTVFFVTFGTEQWKYLAIAYGCVAIVNLFIFSKAPFGPIVEETERTPLGSILKSQIFIILVIVLICNGPIEMCMTNWTSLFAEQGLHVSKTVGDLLGPCLYAAGMGLSRLFYGFKGTEINLEKAMKICGFISAASYFVVVFAPWPLVSLIACGVVGLSTGILCPGCTCILSKTFPKGGVSMFGLLIMFQFFGNALTSNMIGNVVTSVQNSVPAICLKMFPVTDPYELGLRTALFFVACMALVMAIFIMLAERYIKSHNISQENR
jgi:MFS family permease